MAWWAWLLLGWVVVATVAAFWLGAAAAIARRHERASRSHWYSSHWHSREIQRERQAAASGEDERVKPRRRLHH
jgi:hypothetical protein